MYLHISHTDSLERFSAYAATAPGMNAEVPRRKACVTWGSLDMLASHELQTKNWVANTNMYLSAYTAAAAAAKSLQSCPTLCDPIEGSPPGSPVPGFSRQEHWSGLPFPSPMHESEKWKWSRSVVSDS